MTAVPADCECCYRGPEVVCYVCGHHGDLVPDGAYFRCRRRDRCADRERQGGLGWWR